MQFSRIEPPIRTWMKPVSLLLIGVGSIHSFLAVRHVCGDFQSSCPPITGLKVRDWEAARLLHPIERRGMGRQRHLYSADISKVFVQPQIARAMLAGRKSKILPCVMPVERTFTDIEQRNIISFLRC